MADIIFTSHNIWQGTAIPCNSNTEELFKTIDGDYSFIHFYIDGLELSESKVQIYCVKCIKNDITLQNKAILIAKGEKCLDNTDFIKKLADLGYTVFSLDLVGEKGKSRFKTIYPKMLSYANYDEDKIKEISLKTDVKETCWYQWALAVKYATNYIKSNEKLTNIAGIGFGVFANSIIQSCCLSKDFSCMILANNFGWKSFSSLNKFNDDLGANLLSNDILNFSVAVETQSYAKDISCPTLFLGTTNSIDYNIDRLTDTISLIDKNVYSSCNYSVGNIDVLNYDCFNDIVIFLQRFLLKDKSLYLADDIEIILNEKNHIEVTPSLKEIKDITVYYSENEERPQFRVWNKISESSPVSKGVYSFMYSPKIDTKFAYFFAKVKYANDFVICSNIIFKRFSQEENARCEKIIFSSRNFSNENVFFPIEDDENYKTNVITYNNDVQLINGAMSLGGVYCKNGLSTFLVNHKNFNSLNSALIVFDICVKYEGNIYVRLIKDFFGQKIKYSYTELITATCTWQNIKIDLSMFKSDDVKILSNLNEIEAIEFDFDNKEDNSYVINNVLCL